MARLGPFARLRRKLGLFAKSLQKTAPKARISSPSRGGTSPRVQVFTDIPVVPGFVFNTNWNKCAGGPIWPDFSNRWAIRHRHGTRRADVEPPLPAGHLPQTSGGYVWGGQLFYHFGHLCAETCPRLDVSLRVWPDKSYLFMVRPDQDADNLPGFVWPVFDWIGLRREQIEIVRQPMRVQTIHVLPQPEWLMGPVAPPDYLDLLEARTVRHGLVPIPSDLLYVSRVGAIAAGMGAHAGEAYLERLLVQAGVKVMEPSKVPLRDQLARYAGAKTIIFAEGSAVHGRQLLGRIDQKVVILNRRQKNVFAQDALACRTRETIYCEAAELVMEMLLVGQQVLNARALALYNVAAIFECFDAFGVDLRSRWNEADYIAARDRDIAVWLSRLWVPDPRFTKEYDMETSLSLIQNALQGAGIPMPTQAEALAAATA